MTQAQQQCSSIEQLLTFLRGKLSEHDESELQRHLNDCVSCRDRLEDAAADDDSWNEAKRFLGREVKHEVLEGSTDGRQDATPWSLQIRQVLDSLGPTDDPDSLGRIGVYEVTGVIGAGGMGVVLKAHERALERIVAIKVMAPHLASSGSARKRFAREAKAAAAVIHPNVIAIHGVSIEGELPYLVMPFVGGSSLQRRLDKNGPLPTVEVLRVGSQIAFGLAAAHGQGLVHRDIKPANIMLDNCVERVSITDFGLARAVDDATMTRTGVIAGTPQFMSPEQACGAAIDHRSDLFSLGSVLYAMCTGRAPFRAETSYGVLRRITDEEPKPVQEINADIPLWLCAVISKLMQKQPDDRFNSADEVARLLEGCLAHVQNPASTSLPASLDQLSQPLPASSGAASPPRKLLRLLFEIRPRIVKFIAAAAVAFVMIFAGVFILLESDKGTLTIESEADAVPIRIIKGDKVVDRMTVTRSGNSIRVAAGNYRVELDGDMDSIIVENDEIVLKRGRTEHVAIRYLRHGKESQLLTQMPNAKIVLASKFQHGNLDGLRFGERHEPEGSGYWNPSVAEPGETSELFATFPTLGNGIDEVALIVYVYPPKDLSDPSKNRSRNYLIRAGAVRQVFSINVRESQSVAGTPFFKSDQEPYNVGYLELQLDDAQTSDIKLEMLAGSVHIDIVYVVGLPNEQVRRSLKLGPPNSQFEYWLPVSLQMRPQSQWASRLMNLNGWEKDFTSHLANIVQKKINLKSSETQTITIEPADNSDFANPVPTSTTIAKKENEQSSNKTTAKPGNQRDDATKNTTKLTADIISENSVQREVRSGDSTEAGDVIGKLEGKWKVVSIYAPQGYTETKPSGNDVYSFEKSQVTIERNGKPLIRGIVELQSKSGMVLNMRFANKDAADGSADSYIEGSLEFKSNDEFWLAVPDTSIRPSQEAVLAGQPRVVWKLRRVEAIPGPETR